MPVMRPDEIKNQFEMLPESLRQNVPNNDLKLMQDAIEKAHMQAALSTNPSDPATKYKQNLEKNVQTVQDLEKGNVSNVVQSKVKTFNLKKIAQGKPFPLATPDDPFGANTSPEGYEAEQDYIKSNPLEGGEGDIGQPAPTDPQLDPSQPDPQSPQPPQDNAQNQFDSHEALANQLKQYGSVEATQQQNPQLVQAIAGNENAQDAFDRFFSELNDENRLDLAELIYENLPENMKNQQVDTSNPSEGMTIEAPYKKAGSMEEFLNQITSNIKKAATQVGGNKKKIAFNLKTAQHKSSQNIIMWGPEQVRPDPFLRGQPVSDWHIMERNKGFGGDIDGFWGVDWETVWRGNVMDKYSRPYRDTTTGEWVGGYIQKRFEVDKNIPATNNYQLLPGQRAKPVLPEFGSLESRLQAMRNADEGNLGAVYNDTSEPKFVFSSSEDVNEILAEIFAQTDVTTERQLQNVALRPGILGLPSIQRHEQEPAKEKEGSGYHNNYGDEIDNKSAASALKKKLKPEMVDPIRR